MSRSWKSWLQDRGGAYLGLREHYGDCSNHERSFSVLPTLSGGNRKPRASTVGPDPCATPCSRSHRLNLIVVTRSVLNN